MRVREQGVWTRHLRLLKIRLTCPITSTKIESYLRFSTYLCFSSSIFCFNSRISFSFWSFWFSRSLSLSRQSSLSSSLVRSLARASSNCRLMFSLSRRSYRSLGKFIKITTKLYWKCYMTVQSKSRTPRKPTNGWSEWSEIREFKIWQILSRLTVVSMQVKGAVSRNSAKLGNY